jgi:hypothetical protein
LERQALLAQSWVTPAWAIPEIGPEAVEALRGGDGDVARAGRVHRIVLVRVQLRIAAVAERERVSVCVRAHVRARACACASE